MTASHWPPCRARRHVYLPGHYYEAIHEHAVELSGSVQGLNKQVADERITQICMAVITGKCEEVR